MFYTNITMHKDDVYIRYIDNLGNEKNKIHKGFKPRFYVETDEYSDVKSICGKNLQMREFDGLGPAFQWYSFVKGQKPIYGTTNMAQQYISRHIDVEQQFEEWDYEKIRIAYVDIETTVSGGRPDPYNVPQEIYAISHYDSIDKQMYLFIYDGVGNGKNDKSGKFIKEKSQFKENLNVFEFKSEASLLEGYIRFIQKTPPAIMTGWNFIWFDLNYIINRSIKLLGEDFVKKISPCGGIKEIQAKRYLGAKVIEEKKYMVKGISVIDMMDLYKKFEFKPRQSYSLDAITMVELGDNKLKHKSGIPGHLLYKDYFHDAIEYNLKDTLLLDQLEDKKGFLKLLLTFAYYSGSNYEDIMSPIRTWRNIIFYDQSKKNIFYEIKMDFDTKSEKFEGAYVKDTKPGRYDWVVSYDVTSLYPSIIRLLNISPDTKIGKIDVDKHDLVQSIVENDKLFESDSFLTDRKACLAANGVLYDNTRQGFFSKLIEKMFFERILYKNKKKQYFILSEMGPRNLKKVVRAEMENRDKLTNLDDSELNKILDTPSPVEYCKKLEKQCDSVQNAIKIVGINAAYGAMGSPFFDFYDVEMAESVTLTGQSLIRKTEYDINGALNEYFGTSDVSYVIGIDTDSNYITLSREPNVEIDKIDEICNNVIQPCINKSFEELVDTLNAYSKDCLEMGREVVAERGLWVKRKNYCLKVVDDEWKRLDEPKYKIMGLEAIKAAKYSPLAREFIMESYKYILHKDEDYLRKYCIEMFDRFKSLPTMDIAYQTAVNSIYEYDNGGLNFKKGAPINSKAAITYNYTLEKLGISEKYDLISEGDKIRYAKLVKNNPFGSTVMAWIREIPEEFELDKFIDYEDHFYKNFLKPVERVAHAVNWPLKMEDMLQMRLL